MVCKECVSRRDRQKYLEKHPDSKPRTRNKKMIIEGPEITEPSAGFVSAASKRLLSEKEISIYKAIVWYATDGRKKGKAEIYEIAEAC